MLVLSRKSGESIIIDHPKGMVVVEVRRVGGRATLAIQAPKEMRILRGELHPDYVPEPEVCDSCKGRFKNLSPKTRKLMEKISRVLRPS